MKLNKLSIISFATLLGLGFASCERVYDAPLLTEPKVTVGEEGIITIAQYKEKYKSVPRDGQLIEEDFAIRAVVVGNDISGNIYKQIYVQDATGGISIGIDQNNIANDYRVGQEVFIKLQGLAATSYGGVVQIGMMKTSSNRIPYEVAKAHILKDKWPNVENAQPKKVKISQFTDEMVGTLIELENVYFELGGTAPFGDQEYNAVNRNLKDTSGNTLYVRNSKYATFANDIMPKGNGTVVGILSKFNNDYQLFIRSAEDCYGFSGKDPVTGGGPTPDPVVPDPQPDPTAGALLFAGSDFNNWDTFLKSLNQYGLTFGKESASGGIGGSGALHLSGTTDSKNGYLFTAVVTEGIDMTKVKKITFYVKGTAAKSLSINVYNTNTNITYDDNGVAKPAGYINYNVGDVNGAKVITGTTKNDYKGTINASSWTKITLDLTAAIDGQLITLPTKVGDNLIAFKYGSSSAYDLYIDNINFE